MKKKINFYILDENISKKLNQSKIENDSKTKDATLKINKSVQPSSLNDKSTDVDQNELLKRQQQQFQNDPASYNGASRENYSWTQSIKDIDVRVKVRQSFNFYHSNLILFKCFC